MFVPCFGRSFSTRAGLIGLAVAGLSGCGGGSSNSTGSANTGSTGTSTSTGTTGTTTTTTGSYVTSGTTPFVNTNISSRDVCTANTHQSGRATWTILVYLNAASNLQPDSLINIAQMASVGSDSNLNIVVQWKQTTSSAAYFSSVTTDTTPSFIGTRRYKISKHSQADLNKIAPTGIDTNSQHDGLRPAIRQLGVCQGRPELAGFPPKPTAVSLQRGCQQKTAAPERDPFS